MKTIQFFSKEYLERAKKFSSEEVIDFLETFRNLQQASVGNSKLISLKVDENLLKAFRQKCELEGAKYQTKIKDLMRAFLENKN